MPISTVSEKGWVVIPKEMRERHGLKKGAKVRVIDYGGVISIIPVPEDPIRAMQGMFRGRPSLTKALSEFRAEEARRDR